MRVLLAGFGPFPGAWFNPTAALAKSLACRRRPALTGLERTVHVFATSYAAVDRDMPNLLAAKPDVVLIFGLAARRRQISVETRARNALSPRFPDANGLRPARTVITPGGPRALIGNAPFNRLVGAARTGKVPVALSRDAGRYLCNYAYWRALEQARNGRPLVQFVHIPSLRRNWRPRRRRGKHCLLSFAQAAVACERLLIALVAASKR
jgi:pyroglutamyl-peptidase